VESARAADDARTDERGDVMPTPDPNGCPKCGHINCPSLDLSEQASPHRASPGDDCNGSAVDWRALYFAALPPAREEHGTLDEALNQARDCYRLLGEVDCGHSDEDRATVDSVHGMLAALVEQLSALRQHATPALAAPTCGATHRNGTVCTNPPDHAPLPHRAMRGGRPFTWTDEEGAAGVRVERELSGWVAGADLDVRTITVLLDRWPEFGVDVGRKNRVVVSPLPAPAEDPND
jgi:hypothetical protein